MRSAGQHKQLIVERSSRLLLVTRYFLSPISIHSGVGCCARQSRNIKLFSGRRRRRHPLRLIEANHHSLAAIRPCHSFRARMIFGSASNALPLTRPACRAICGTLFHQDGHYLASCRRRYFVVIADTLANCDDIDAGIARLRRAGFGRWPP